LVWGDSHAAALSYGLRLRSPAVGQLTAASCPPIPEVRSAKAHCAEINRFVLSWVAQHRPRLVLLHAAWMNYRTPGDLASFGRLLADLRRMAPGSRVVVLGPVPTWQPTLPQFLLKSGQGLEAEVGRRPPAFSELQQTDAALRSVAQTAGAEFVSAVGLYCPEERCPLVIRDAGQFVPTAWDEGHLTAAGSKRLAGKLGAVLALEPAE